MAKEQIKVQEVGKMPAAVVKSVKTPEQVKAAEAKRAARAEARKRVTAFVAANVDQLDTIANDIMLFVGAERAARPSGASVNQALRTALLEAGDKGLSEMDVFLMFKVGRPEMVVKARILVLCPNPADRVWVKFDEKTEVYAVVGKGANPPKDWTGYVPASKESL